MAEQRTTEEHTTERTTSPRTPGARVVAVIPARGGSKGVPGKNIAPVGGVPLVGRAIRAALAVPAIDSVWVSTDDDAIAEVARRFGAGVVDRPAELANDSASSEAALLHALDTFDTNGTTATVLVFIQATSPFIDSEALARAVDRVAAGEEDVVFSAFETYAFLWQRGEAGATGVNHDHSFRPRRQDREPHFQETGAFYVMDAAGFRAGGYRFFGRVGIEETDAMTAVEIDNPDELEFSRALAAVVDPGVTGLDIDALVMDFDGVHTDDRVIVDENGTESVIVSRSDGMGIGMLREAGVPMLILSKERNPVVTARATKLGIKVAQGIDDKLTLLNTWCSENGYPLERVAYIGNDKNDEACLRAVGWPIVVPEAHSSVSGLARITLTKQGGRGAIRELAEMILASRKEIK